MDPQQSTSTPERTTGEALAPAVPSNGGADAAAGPAAKPLILDLAALGVNLSARSIDLAGIQKIIPHRHEMCLLDAIVWKSEDHKQGVAVWNVKDTEFWCRGHFPGKPMLPGVLQVEAGAQLSSYLYNIRFPEPRIAAFTHIKECSFRNPVLPGDTFFLLCQELTFSPRRFSSRIQGVVNGKITFDATINGMTLSA